MTEGEALLEDTPRAINPLNWIRSCLMQEETDLLECDLCDSEHVRTVTKRGGNAIYHLCGDCSREYPFMLYRMDPPPPPAITQAEKLWLRDNRGREEIQSVLASMRESLEAAG